MLRSGSEVSKGYQGGTGYRWRHTNALRTHAVLPILTPPVSDCAVTHRFLAQSKRLLHRDFKPENCLCSRAGRCVPIAAHR